MVKTLAEKGRCGIKLGVLIWEGAHIVDKDPKFNHNLSSRYSMME